MPESLGGRPVAEDQAADGEGMIRAVERLGNGVERPVADAHVTRRICQQVARPGRIRGSRCHQETTRLSGVVDWDAAGPGRLPLLDLLHLELTRSAPFADVDWGRALLERLLPLARAGGDEGIARYCGELGLSADRSVLEALVFAYWLDYAAYQLRTHPVRRVQPAWIEGNVELVVRSAANALTD